MLTLRFAVGIEEVNLYKDDGTVIHFNNPKFHVGSGATMYVVSGRAENKTIQDIIPSLLQNSALGQAAAAAAAAKKVLLPLHLWPHFRCDLPPSRFPSIFFFPCLCSNPIFCAPSQGGDDDVPELVESFESS